MTKRAAIILSGGKAERFQSEKQTWQDKALVELSGKPLLVHAVENVQNHVDETVVVVNNDNRVAQYSEVLARHHVSCVSLVKDIKIDRFGGPLLAIYTGLKFAKADRCLTLPSDMPLVQPRVVEHLFSSAEDSRVVIPMWPNGRLETLVMVLERRRILEIAQALCRLKRPRSDDIVRGALKVLFLSIVGEIQKLDPDLRSFVNINALEDLTNLQPRRAQGLMNENMRFDLGNLPVRELKHLQEAAALAQTNRWLEASEIFALTGARFESSNLFFWAAVSRENEAKSLKKQIEHQTEPKLAAIQITRVREAFLAAANNYELESEMHEKNCFVFVAERARSDKKWCKARAAELPFKEQRYGR
jgi:molybdenum cofactor guanylyltransferase